MKKLLIMASVALAGALLATPAQAVEPQPETRTLTTHITDRPDSGEDTNYWALDTFKRDISITGGPYYWVPSPQNADKDVKATAEVQSEMAAEIKDKDKVWLCDWVKYFHLKWEYTATFKDDGTFKGKEGEKTPGKVAPADTVLPAGVTGQMNGGATAVFLAPAHWCTYDTKDYDKGEGPNDKSTGQWPALLFGPKTKNVELVKWGWTYTTCGDLKLETWVNTKDGNSGDIVGKACPSPSPSPVPSPSTVPVSLPLTGPPTSMIVVVAGVLLATGVVTMVVTRRRRNATD